MERASVVDAARAVGLVTSGMNVFVHGAMATPVPLLEALAAREDLRDVRVFHLHTEGTTAFASEACDGRVRSVSFFAGGAVRGAIEAGRAEYMPVFLSDIPGLLKSGEVRIDAALVQLSPADRHGLCTLGTSCDVARAAVDTVLARGGPVIAEVNARMPRTLGATTVPAARLAAVVMSDRALPEHPAGEPGAVEQRIGELIAGLIEDGSTLQLGIGGIPDAVVARLGDKNDLGVHTEMFADGLVRLIERGVVTNKCKVVHPGRTTTSFVLGSRRVLEYIHDNPLVEFHPCDRTNDTSIIRMNPRVVAVNSAISIDLTGQVCADSIGHRVYSGIGGQMDFVRGAALSEGGKPIIALPSMAAGGKVSRIAFDLTAGSGVVTTRGHVHWVVTEHGAVNLHGKTLRERAELLISIADPSVRGELRREAARVRHFVFG